MLEQKTKHSQASALYVSNVFFISLKLFVLYIFSFHIWPESFMKGLALILATITSTAAIMAIGFMFKQEKQIRAFMILSVLLTALLYGNLLYYRFYIDYITVPVLLQFQNVGGLSQSTLELIHPVDILLFVDYLLIYFLLKKQKLALFTIRHSAMKRIIPTIIVVPLAFSIIVNNGFWKQSFDKEHLVKSLGMYYYHAYDAFLYSKTSVGRVLADENELSQIRTYVNEKQTPPSDYFGAAKGKNVIFLFLESTQDFVVDFDLNGNPVTPFLNDLKEESLYFSNFYHQTAQGKTSDAEFITDNSLYPLTGGSLFVRKTQNTYYSMPHILKEAGYYTASFHGNDAQFWNRELMYESLGYDRFFSKDDYDVREDNSVNYGLKDIDFLEQSLSHFQSLPEPFYGKMLLLTNHFPFLLDEEDQYIQEAATSQGVVNRYFTTVRYQDEALKKFFEDIKQTDLYENSIFVLMGDHYGISRNYSDAMGELFGLEITPVRHMNLQKVPLLIHIPGVEGKEIKTVGGQIDLRPTILDLLGIENDQQIGLGTNLLTDDRKDLAIFRDGSFTTDQITYIDGKCFDRKKDEEIDITNCEVYFDEVQEQLNVSDQIIFGDLLRFLPKKEYK